MRNLKILMLVIALAASNVKADSNNPFLTEMSIDSSLLDFYCQYSTFTDPGEYEYLYENLPESLSELCVLIKSQSLHPYAELPRYKDQIPQERWDEYNNFPTVESILKDLARYDTRGFVKDRQIKDRLVLGCRENAIILASILRYRGIPVRVRCGHVTYLRPGIHASHTLCEVWNADDKRWMLVDPSVNRVDFSKQEFDYSNELWLHMRNDQIDPSLYGNPGHYSGFVSILGKVCPDLAAILGMEHPVYQYAPILDYAFENDNQLTVEQTEMLDEICVLMNTVEAANFEKLRDIYNTTPEVQITLSFDTGETAVESDENNRKQSGLLDFKLYQNYPNPFNPETRFQFSLSKRSAVKIEIFDQLGRKVNVLANAVLNAGQHTATWNGLNSFNEPVASGIYFYRLLTENFSQTRKMLLQR